MWAIRIVASKDTYIADSQRILIVQPDRTKIYTPFPEFEETVPTSGATTKRSSYFLAGQLIAVRVVTGSNSTLYFTFADHLGNVSAVTYSGGTLVAGSLARYEPYGGFRTEPTSNPAITDRGFTGHKSNNTGTYDIGLVYMNARYYLPEIGRFISSDTIVPDPQNPQSFNRYSYTLNNPINLTDPSGHCAQEDDACWGLADQLYQQYGWSIDGIWTVDDLQIFLQAGEAIVAWFNQYGGGEASGRARAIFGGTRFAHADWIGSGILNAHHVRSSTIYLLGNFDVGLVIHELAHILDNQLGFSWPVGSALLGGGPADGMADALGADSTRCLNRSVCSGYSTPNEEAFPSRYARSGSSEDFAESFRLAVLDGAGLQDSNPQRAAFLAGLAASLTTVQSEYVANPSIYLSRRLIPVNVPLARSPMSMPGTPVPPH